MNSLNYLSRQLDVLATSGTPPSTPTHGTQFNTTGRPPRAKSYGRIIPRRTSHQGQQQSAEPSPPFPTHASKRSFSSPALWSFRKSSLALTPTSSLVSTPIPVVKRTTSYDFGSPHKQQPDSDSEPTPQRSLLLRILVVIWDVLYSLWLRVSSYLVLPSFLVPRSAQAIGDNTRGVGEADTSGDEKEETDDDGIVARAPKRSLVDSQYKTSEPVMVSLETYPMSTTATLIQEDSLSSSEQNSFVLDPPSREEVEARTVTPRIDLIPPTPKSEISPPTAQRKNSISGSLLPNPLSSSLLTRSSTSPPSAIAPGSNLYQPLQSPRKTPGVHQPKTLVLDLDETLIHSTSKALRAHAGGGLFSMGGFGFGFGEKRGREAGHMVEVVLGGRCTLYHVYKRPFVDYFLRKVSSWYTLVIFTASMQEYADPVIDWLDAGRGILSKRLFRESCTQLANGSYTKDLSLVEADLSRVCLIDNSPVSYNVNPANGIPIEGWTSDPSDEALLHLLPVLDSLRFATDVRRILGIRLFN